MMDFFDRLHGKKKTKIKTILMKCESIQDIGIFFDEASPKFLKAFWSLSPIEQKQVLREVLRELHPDVSKNEIERISKEIFEDIPFIYDANKCSSCGGKIDKRSVRYSSKCRYCGRVYCQLCVMNLVDTPGEVKCVCNGDLTPYGMNWDEL